MQEMMLWDSGAAPAAAPVVAGPAPATEVVIRDYQAEAIERIQKSGERGHRRILLQAPTGSGKTIIASAIMEYAAQNNARVLFLAHRRELIYQCADKLSRFGVSSGIIMAGEERDHEKMVQVGSLQTLWTRAIRQTKMDLPDVDLLVIDEAHRSCSHTYVELIKRYPKAIVLGLTATPIRKDGKGLGDIYSDMVLCPSIAELTRMGNLVPLRYYAPSKPDLQGIKITAGDYNERQLEDRMDTTVLVGNVVENWARIARDRKTVVFASGVRHSLHLKEEFERAGVRAEHIDGQTPHDTRRAILERLDKGDLEVVCNCMVLTEGWDSPPVSACVLARPTKSIGLYIQMAGRILRPFPGKTDAVLIDHSGCAYDHGRIEEFTDWELTKTLGQKIAEKAEKRKKERMPINCSNCAALYYGQKHCPECGHIPETFPRGVEYHDGYLREVNEFDKEISGDLSKISRTDFYAQLLGICENRGFKQGWAAFKYKERFGNWPNGMSKIAKEPSVEVVAWVAKMWDKWRKQVKTEPERQPI